jgi:hypothetical protein
MATKGRTPTPKSQYEISTGSPQDLNRGVKNSFRDDTTKPFSIEFKDIDESLMYYFQNVIKPFVIQNGQRVAVPIIYGSPERWKSIQRDGYYRDKEGKIMAPLITFKRNSITPIKGQYNKLDANNPSNIAYFQKKYNKQNAYDKFNILNNRVPINEYYAIVVPNYVTISYSCVIMTYYMEQLNKIVESVTYASDSYWGNPERFKFRTTIDSITTITELTTGEDRVAKATFDVSMNGYIIPDIPQKDLNVDKKVFSTGQFVVDAETIVNLNNVVNNNRPQKYIDTNNPQNTDTSNF